MFFKDIESALDWLRNYLNAKAVGYEIFASETSGKTVECSGKKVEAFRVRSDSGVGIRVLSGARSAFGFSNLLDRGYLEALVSRTIEASQEADEDKWCCFSTKAIDGAILEGIFDPAIEDHDEERLIKTALLIEESAMGFDPRIRKARKASYSETLVSTRTMNSNDVEVANRATFFSGQ
ncbi:MAG: hypothetical protein HY880_09305, partial [Deltaproteobacteria bacterium]|nr:hypothetical protein [Deltaproteobacteria bacterium]